MRRIRRPGLAVVASVMAVTTSGVLPIFLAGALAVQMRAELGYSASGIGIATAVAFAAAAAGSAPFGRLVERVGPRAGMRAAAATGCLAMVGLAAFARSFGDLLVWLALAGLANGLAQPASNAMIVRGVAAGRHGLAFGIKQSAIPVATLLGGLAVPVVALTVGWRWAFVGASALAAVAAVVVPRPEGRGGVSKDVEGRRPSLGPLVVLATGAGLGAAVGGTLGAFVTTGGVHAGLAPGTAGLVQSLGSAASLSVRLGAGWMGDRRATGHLRAVTSLLLVGAAGFVLMAAALPAPFVAGVVVAYGGAWAWPGLFNFAVTRLYPDFPAAATGITQTGVYIGGAAGPAAFGALVDRTSMTAGWLVFGGLAVVAAVTIAAARRGKPVAGRR